METPCCGIECTRLERTITVIIAGNSTQKVIYGSNKGSCLATDKTVLEFVLQKHENGLPVHRATVLMKALEVTTLPYVPQQHFKAAGGLGVRCMHHERLHIHCRTTIAQKLPTNTLKN
jgi:hypothetical protein